MLTLREQAVGAYREAMSAGSGKVLGLDREDMALVVTARQQRARLAVQTLREAIGSDRYSINEPDDSQLERMLRRVEQLQAELRERHDVRGGAWPSDARVERR